MSVPESVPEPCRRLRWLLVVVGLCMLLPLAAAEPPRSKLTAAERQAKLKERNRLWTETQKLRAEGKVTEALAAAEKILAIERQLFGDRSASVVESLQWLAQLHEQREDFTAAGKCLREVRDIQTARYDKDDWRVTDARLALADVNQRAKLDTTQRKQLAEAERLNGQVIALYRKGRSREAIAMAERVRTLRKQALGAKHPAYAGSLNNLAALYRAMGDYAKAEPLSRQARDILKQALGEKHPSYATSLNNLALLYESMGDYASAERLLRQGLETSRGNLDLAAAAQSERQQLAMASALRGVEDAYLTLAPKAKRAGASAYADMLAWKGAVLARQRRMRLQRGNPELAADFAQLDRVAGRLAALALAIPSPKQQAAYRRQIENLSEEKERLESALARRSAPFRKEREAERLTPARHQAALPADAALVDFLEYVHRSPPAKGKGKWQIERRLAAFVVRRDSLVQLDLGPVQPITEAIDSWRRTTRRTRPVLNKDDPAAELRRRLWQPLLPHLGGARTVLVSPDGALARLPLAALPGSKPDTYLLEEVALAIVPVPQLLPELLAAGKVEAKGEPSLLLVGDVDFGAAPGVADVRGGSRSAARGSRAGALMSFKRLDATREEILAVADSFRRGHRRAKALVTELRDEEATEAAVRLEASRHRYLHFATHGFFAPPELRSALAPTPARAGEAAVGRKPDLFDRKGVSGFHPGLLAGANRPASTSTDDGILTALEVAELDLSGVQLAVLSACETGLGETAGGEGVLGLQRAFQTAGARSVVASLWQVDDDATRKLMVRFYANQWRTKEPLGRLAALREAQLWMLREGVKRGLVRLTEKEATGPARTPPLYWAAFVLSGDWR